MCGFCNVWVCLLVCVVVLVVCVLVLAVFSIVCTVFCIVLFMYICYYYLICFDCTNIRTSVTE
jgi:hypothetical protein